MQGRDFLNPARALAAATTEPDWRTAAVCAYYALMLEGRDVLQRWGFSPKARENVHSAVRLRFTYAHDLGLKDIGRALDELVHLRNKAHYQLAPSREFGTNQRVLNALVVARDAVALLDRIDQDPAQQTGAIAALRAAGF